MKITLTTFLLTLTVLGACLIGQAQTAKIEQHGWKLVYVTYKDEKASTQRADEQQYGEPSIAIFVRDYPYQDGKDYPRLLVLPLLEDIRRDDNQPRVRKRLDEFDCPRRLQRTIRWFWSDNREENRRKLSELTKWNEVPPDTPVEAIYKYACRSWWTSTKN